MKITDSAIHALAAILFVSVLLGGCRGRSGAPSAADAGEETHYVPSGISIADQLGLCIGDILFASIPDSTGENLFIHAAIIDVDTIDTWILDATLKRGVARYPIDTFLVDFKRHDGSYPTFEVMRLKDTIGVSSFVAKARTFIGEKYDRSFKPNNKSHYCTELIYDSYIRNGEHLFKTGRMDFRNNRGGYFPYWQKQFKKMKVDVPQGKEGILPKSMHNAECLSHVSWIDIRQREGDPEIAAFIRDMYETGRYNDEEFLRKHCSKALLARLAEEYDYEGEGYAGWEFRSGAQDGPNSNLNDIISITADGGWYTYRAYDMGLQFKRRVNVVKENGNFIICGLESVENN